MLVELEVADHLQDRGVKFIGRRLAGDPAPNIQVICIKQGFIGIKLIMAKFFDVTDGKRPISKSISFIPR